MQVLAFDIGLINLAYSYTKLINDAIVVDKCSKINIKDMYFCSCGKKAVKQFISKNNVDITFHCLEHIFKGCKNIPPITTAELCFNLIHKLNKLDNEINIDNIDVIVIENQPSLKNPVMKSIQTMLMTYYVLKKKTIKLQHPKFKLFGYKATSYTDAKKYGILLCKNILGDEFIKVIGEDKKIDDLCDAILHSAYYLKHNK